MIMDCATRALTLWPEWVLEQFGNVFEHRPLPAPILGVKGAQGLWTLAVPVGVPEVAGG